MLDLAFLAVAIFAIYKANKGEYNETACNIAMVVGIIAGVVGCIVGIMRGQGMFVFLNIIVFVGAFGLRFAAKLLAKLVMDKKIATAERLEQEFRNRARYSNPDAKPVYTDDNFDDEELRFGKGGYTERAEVYTDDTFDIEEPLFGNSGYNAQKKVSLEKTEVSLGKKKVSLDKTPAFDDEELRFGKGGYTDPKL